MSNLNLKILEDMDPSSTTQVGRWTSEGVLLKVELDQGDHEAQLNREAGETVGGKVQER